MPVLLHMQLDASRQMHMHSASQFSVLVTQSMQGPQVRVCDLFKEEYDGMQWASSAQRAKAYMAFYQRVRQVATNAKRRRSYAKLRYETRQRELLQDLKRTPGRQPRTATISKYRITWDAVRNEWVLEDSLQLQDDANTPH